MMNLDCVQLAVLVISAVLIGINKTALPGVGVLPVILLSIVFPARQSTGIQLIMLAMADLMAVAYYRRHADWKILLRLLPFAFVGLAAGSLILRFLKDSDLRVLIGLIVLALMIVSFVKQHLAPEKIPSGRIISGFFGFLVGVTTQLANAAGPVAAIYFLAMKLPKDKYMGCSAWFFLILNWTKLPIFVWEGRITMDALKIDLLMIPALVVGAVGGVLLLKNIPQKWFENIIQILILISVIKLLVG